MPTYDLESDAFFRDPTPVLDRMRVEAPVCWHAPLDAWVLTRYDDVAFVLRDPRFSVGRGGAIARCPHAEVAPELDACNDFFGQWMVFSDPPRHERLRLRVAELFTPLSVRRLRPWVEARAESMVYERVRSGEPFDFVAELAVPFPAEVTAHLLGIGPSALGALQDWTDDCFAFFGAGQADARTVRRAYLSMRQGQQFFARELAARRDEPCDDLLGMLAEDERPGLELTEEERVGLAMTLLAGAFGTTSHLIAQTLLALLEHPTERDRVARDPSLAAGAVEETLRIDGPALSLVRVALEDVPIGNRTVRAGERVYCMLHAANHDPGVFDDPSRFDVTRDARRHLGLGLGRHFCLGASLTRMEAEVAIAALAPSLPTLRLVGPPRRTGNLAMRGLDSLWVESGAFGTTTRPMVALEQPR